MLSAVVSGVPMRMDLAATGEFYVEIPLGVVNTRYFFGSISTESGGRLLRAGDLDDEKVDESETRAKMLINWFGRAQTDEPPYIWWHI